MAMQVPSLQYSNIAKLFSTAMFKALSEENNEERIAHISKVHRATGFSSTTVKHLLVESYKLIQRNYPNEYVYKNEAIRKLILKNHPSGDAAILSEFNCNVSKADILVANGTCTVYEIKTDLDTLNRLEEQLSSYTKTFPHVNVLCSPASLSKVLGMVKQKSVGLIVYNPKTRAFETVKESTEDLSVLIPEFMFSTFRMSEYKRIALEEFGYIPQVSNTKIYKTCLDLYKRLPIETQKEWLTKTLRERRISREQHAFAKSLPVSLYSLAVSRHYGKQQRENINRSLSKIL
jgi:hypothetical protein